MQYLNFNINIKYLLLFLLILINCLGEGLNALLAIPCIIILFICLTFFKLQNFYLVTKLSLKKLSDCKLYIIFMLYILICFFLKGCYGITRFFSAFVFGLIVSVFLCYLYGVYFAYKIETKKIIKLLVIILYTYLLFGLLELIVFKYGNSTLMGLYEFTSGRPLYKLFSAKTNMLFPRIQSFFGEPSQYGWFLSCNIPIILKLGTSKYRIFKNKLANLFTKKTLIPLSYISLLFTQSPIWIVFGGIVTIVYKTIDYKKKVKKIFLVLLLLLPFIVLILINSGEVISVLSANKVINRIYLTLLAFGDIDKLIIYEPSLANRLISYTNMFCIYLKHPFIGVGWGNLLQTFIKQLMISPVSLTDELRFTIHSANPAFNPATFFKVLAETGTIGIILFYSIFVKTIDNARKTLIYSQSLEKDFMQGLLMVVVCYMCFNFYDSILYHHYFWFIFGIIGGVYLKKIYVGKTR